MGLLATAGIEPWFAITGNRVVASRRRSQQDGSLIFALTRAHCRTAHSACASAAALADRSGSRGERDHALNDGAFELTLGFGEVAVIHCVDS